MNNEIEKHYFLELLIKSFEGQISSDEVGLLNRFIKSDDEVAYLYAEFFDTVSGLVDMDKRAFSPEDNDSTKYDVWLTCLADEEKTAQAVEMSKKEPEEDETPTETKKVRPTVSKFSVFSLLLSSAALIFVIVYAFFISMGRGVEVATLADSMNAKWADIASPMEKGTRMATGNNRWLLREGYAELLFDNQARITLEGPVDFQILAEDRIGLNYGKVYARVPKDAAGFSVYTQNAKIIDLGTEFGVQAEIGGNTQVHVLKGKTMVMAGKTDRVNLEISQGNARKISGETGEVSDIGCRSDYFVRVINSRSNYVWKGQSQINLADIVGGGNGLGMGEIGMGIDPISGKPSRESWGKRESANDYHPIPSNPFVDGVFIPNGKTPQIISSQGHLFRECPATSGLCCEHILSSPARTLDSRVDRNAEVTDSLAHSILLHANMGITFDLQAIRTLLPGVKIERFQSKFGIRKWAIRPSASNADFWVLVDGKLRYEKKQVKIDELYSVDIELAENERFLTLIETDGGDPEGRILDGLVLSPNDSDWGIYADPILVLE
jgi:hypothetical protein